MSGLVGSVTQAVKDVLNRDRFYLEVLQSQIANLTALAEKIKPDVEKVAQCSVNTNTIVAALKRVSDRLPHKEHVAECAPKNFADFKMSLTDNLIDLVFDEENLDCLPLICDKLSDSDDADFNLLHTPKGCRVMTDNLQLLKELDLGKKNSKDFTTEKKFAKLTLDFLQEQNESILNNLLSQISNILYKYHINVHSAFFSPSGITLVADDSKAIRLYDILHNELLESV